MIFVSTLSRSLSPPSLFPLLSLLPFFFPFYMKTGNNKSSTDLLVKITSLSVPSHYTWRFPICDGIYSSRRLIQRSFKHFVGGCCAWCTLTQPFSVPPSPPLSLSLSPLPMPRSPIKIRVASASPCKTRFMKSRLSPSPPLPFCPPNFSVCVTRDARCAGGGGATVRARFDVAPDACESALSSRHGTRRARSCDDLYDSENSQGRRLKRRSRTEQSTTS